MKRVLTNFLALAGLATFATLSAAAQAVITSGDVSLGVSNTGSLGAGTLPAGSNDPGAKFGIYYIPTKQDAIAPGCFCEGWGVAVNNTTAGWSANDNGSNGAITPVSFSSTASTATSVTNLAGTSLQVTQAFAPSAGAPNNLFQDTVTLHNTGATAITDVKYSRAMDWDIPPTEFNEYVSIGGWPASALVFSNDNGFCAPNPIGTCSAILPGTTNDNFTKAGPTDQGSFFTFDLGGLAAGASTTFDIFYGAGGNEAAAIAALSAVGAEVFALGYASNGPGGSANTANPVFAFGFAGVGGTPIGPGPVPEPGTLLLLGSGLAGLAGLKSKFVKA